MASSQSSSRYRKKRAPSDMPKEGFLELCCYWGEGRREGKREGGREGERAASGMWVVVLDKVRVPVDVCQHASVPSMIWGT